MYVDDRDMSSIAESTPIEERSAIFSNEEIASFLEDAGDDVLTAAGYAMMAIANNRQLLVQARRIGKTVVDYGNARKDYLVQAREFLKQSSQSPADEVAEIAYNDFGLRRILINETLRQG